MLEYLEKFKQLPQEVKDILSNPDTLAVIDSIEKEYGLELVSTIIRVAIKELPVDGLAGDLRSEYQLDEMRAAGLENDLKEKIFSKIGMYLGIVTFETLPELKQQAAKTSLEAALEEVKPPPPFYFSAEDEEDVKSYKTKLADAAPGLNKAKAEDYINEMVAEINIHFSSNATQERFKQIMKTYFFGIRDRFSTKTTLSKGFDAGGLGLDDKTVEVIMEASDKKIAIMKGMVEDGLKEAIHPRKKIEIGGLRDFEYDLKAELEKGNVLKHAQEEKTVPLDISHEIAPPHPAIAGKANSPFLQIDAVIRQNASAKPAPGPSEPIVKTDKMVAFTRPSEQGGKKKMDDVVRPKKEKKQNYKYVMSPIDELKNMDTESFRRMSDDPDEACRKIWEKLGLLEEEDYGKKIAGIKAWRQSPIYRLYLAMGQQSIIEKKTIEEVIETRRRSGTDTLSGKEFDAIMDFNKEIRF